MPLPPITVAGYAPLLKVGEFHMKEKRFASAAVTDGRYIYIIGGLGGEGTPLDSIERFDPATGVSEQFARLHVGRFWHQAALHAGKIYVLGGSSRQFRGNVSTPQYVDDLRASPAARAAARANEAELEVKYGSGFDPMSVEHLAPEPSMEVIDLATRQVTSRPDPPDTRVQAGCAMIGDELYVFGGRRIYHQQLSWTNTVQVYSVTTGRWRAGVPMPTPRGTEVAAVDGPFIVAPGGYDGTRALDAVEAFNPRNQTWIILPALCRESSAHAVVFLGHYLFLFGDYGAPGEMIAYDLMTRKSQAFTLQYTPARHAGAAVVNGKIYIVGGKPFKYADPLDTIQVFVPTPAKTGP